MIKNLLNQYENHLPMYYYNLISLGSMVMKLPIMFIYKPVQIYEEDAPSKGSRSKVGERKEVFKWKPKTDKRQLASLLL